MNNNEATGTRRTASPTPDRSSNSRGTPQIDESSDILTRKVPSQQGTQLTQVKNPQSQSNVGQQGNLGGPIGQPGQVMPPGQPGQMMYAGQPMMMPNGQPMMMMQNGQPMMMMQNGQPMMMPNGQPMMMMQNGQPVMMQGGPQMYRPGMGGPIGAPGYPPSQPVHPNMAHPNMAGPPMANNQMPNRPPEAHGNHQYPVNRFTNDNKGLQNLQVFTAPSAFESTQIASAKCSAWCGTWVPCCGGCCPNPFKIVPEGFSGVIMRFDKFYKLVGPGQHYVLHEVDKLEILDKREKVVELKQQSVVSKDNTSFKIDAVLYYRISNTYKSRFAVTSLPLALMDLAVTTLRNAVGRMTMQQFLEMREHFSDLMEKEITPVVVQWGANVTRILVQDVLLPPEFRTSFSSSAVAKKISEAQVISSKADVEVAKLMRDAAEALSTDAAFQIRYIDALEAITNSSNPKMVFFPASYGDVGTANHNLLDSVTEEVESLLRKR